MEIRKSKSQLFLVFLAVFMVFTLLISMNSVYVSAQDEDVDDELDVDDDESDVSNADSSDADVSDDADDEISGEIAQKNLAFTWLSNQVKGAWPKSVEEISFALLALTPDSKLRAEGKTVLLNKNPGKSGSNIEDSSLALLALTNIGEETDYVEEWLLSRAQPFKASNLEWRIQLDIVGATSCDISYGGKIDEVELNEDKTLELTSPVASPKCLSVVDDFWLKISNTADSGKCLEKKYSINCGERIRASLYFKKESIFFVPSKTLYEEFPELEIESMCLADSSGCDYGANLWAAYSLAKAGSEDANLLLPYLISLEGAEEGYMPYAFLYLLTENEDYAERLLEDQEKKGYWYSTKYGKWHSTALAYTALKEYYAEENITKAKKYILDHQSESGSWDNNVGDTAFLYYALWPSSYYGAGEDNLCTEEGYECKNVCDSEDEEEAREHSYYCPTRVCCRQKAYSVDCTTTEDCLDPDCNKITLPNDCTCEYNIEKNCDDGCDNDGDYLIDDEDTDCQIPECVRQGFLCCTDCEWGHKSQYDYSCENGVCCEECEREKEICDDKEDNDDDGFIDCDDPDCELNENCQRTSILWYIIPGLAVILIAAYIYFNKTKGFNIITFFKEKISKIKKPTAQSQPVQFAKGGIPMKPGMRPPTARQATAARPAATAARPGLRRFPARKEKSMTETELEKTMKKLKEMGKKK